MTPSARTIPPMNEAPSKLDREGQTVVAFVVLIGARLVDADETVVKPPVVALSASVVIAALTVVTTTEKVIVDVGPAVTVVSAKSKPDTGYPCYHVQRSHCSAGRSTVNPHLLIAQSLKTDQQ